MYWCFHCYAVNDHPTGPCDACGQPVEAPDGLSYTDGLVWALHHPDGDRAVLAARTLGRLGTREAVPALRAAAASGRDIYLREAALRSVIAIEGAASLRHWLEELSRSAPFNVRAVAAQALRAVLSCRRISITVMELAVIALWLMAPVGRSQRPDTGGHTMTPRQTREWGQDRGHLTLPAQKRLALRYAIRSDVGLLRKGNEDSAYAGPHLLAVADGVGGHAAGEVASAVAITMIAPLDGEDPGWDLVAALGDAVATANVRLRELITSDPAIEGMGTTLTALLWWEGYAALCHIGDSRAYLLRDGRFVQLTHDHTLVQSLVDEGKITEDDVAAHPYRSLLLRALEGRTIADPDLTPLETHPGDRYLLCSDGLSGVVSEQTLHQALSSVRDLEEVTSRLIELANRGGGPDNITCIVADVIDTRSSRMPPTWQPVFAGAAGDAFPTGRYPSRAW